MQEATPDLQETAREVVRLFPSMSRDEQRLSLELYRLLAEGQAAPTHRLAERLGRERVDVERTLRGWPGVFFNEDDEILGYWGLSPAFETPHRVKVDGRVLHAWCAWDTLFLPQLLGKTAEVESVSPKTRAPIRLTVDPTGVRHVEPQGVVMSFLMPDRQKVQEDVVTSFCRFLHFFPGQQEGQAWLSEYPRTQLLSLDAAFELGRLKDVQQYPDFVR